MFSVGQLPVQKLSRLLPEVGQKSQWKHKAHGGFQTPTCSRASCAWAVGFLMVQATVYVLLHPDPTQGGSLSLESLCHYRRPSAFSLAKRSESYPIIFGLLASLASPEAIPDSLGWTSPQSPGLWGFLSGAGHPEVESGAKLEGWFGI